MTVDGTGRLVDSESIQRTNAAERDAAWKAEEHRVAVNALREKRDAGGKLLAAEATEIADDDAKHQAAAQAAEQADAKWQAQQQAEAQCEYEVAAATANERGWINIIVDTGNLLSLCRRAHGLQ